MRKLSGKFMKAVGQVLPESAVWEHATLHNHFSFIADIAQYIRRGYWSLTPQKNADLRGEIAFFENNTGHRVRLVEKCHSEHEVWAVENLGDLEQFRVFVIGNGDFEILSDLHGEDYELVIFRFIETGEVGELVWRKTPIFTDVFKPNAAPTPEPAH